MRSRPAPTRIALLLCLALASTATQAFDYWVLALSWSPEHCAASRDQASACDASRGLVVSGLWRQLDAGPAPACDTGPEAGAADLARAAPLMLDAAQAQQQWQQQGRCSGLEAGAYFDALAAARAQLQAPDAFLRGRANQRLSKTFLEKAVLAANPQLSAEGLTIECRSHYLTELRLCLDRQWQPRACGAEVGDICERELIIRPG